MAAGGGGAWKVAYADFVTAMMAFFLVMWIVAQNKPVKEAVAKYFTDPYGLSDKPGRSNTLIPLPANGSPTIKSPPLIKAKTAAGKSSADPGSKTSEESDQRSRSPGKAGMSSVNDDPRTVGSLVQFDEDSADLNETARQSLDELLPELQGKSFRIEVRGHTSGKPISPVCKFKDPWELSYARAMETMKYLVEHGISPRRIRMSQAAANEQSANSQADGLKKPASRVEIYALNELVYEPGAARAPRDGRPGKASFKRTSLHKAEKAEKAAD